MCDNFYADHLGRRDFTLFWFNNFNLILTCIYTQKIQHPQKQTGKRTLKSKPNTHASTMFSLTGPS